MLVAVGAGASMRGCCVGFRRWLFFGRGIVAEEEGRKVDGTGAREGDYGAVGEASAFAEGCWCYDIC